MARRYLWKDKEVSAWAKAYIDEECTLAELEKSIGIPHSTMWWCFQHRLAYIDDELYVKVLSQLKYNKTHHRIVKRKRDKLPVRCCFCNKIIKGWGNDPGPANKSDDATCCDGCNIKIVIPARLKQMEGQK